MKFLAVCFLLVGTAVGTTTNAIDFSQPIGSAQMECLKKNNVGTVLVRGYIGQKNGMTDYNSCNTFKLAQAFDIHSNLYMEMAPKGSKTGGQQFMDMYNNLNTTACGIQGDAIEIVWLMVRHPENWHKNTAKNVVFIQDVLTTAGHHGTWVQIYTNKDDWQTITNGTSITSFNSIYETTLWLANAPNFGQAPTNLTFEPFAGWTTRTVWAYQYAEHQNICGVSCNYDMVYY